jgi:hypothetical protein
VQTKNIQTKIVINSGNAIANSSAALPDINPDTQIHSAPTERQDGLLKKLHKFFHDINDDQKPYFSIIFPLLWLMPFEKTMAALFGLLGGYMLTSLALKTNELAKSNQNHANSISKLHRAPTIAA